MVKHTILQSPRLGQSACSKHQKSNRAGSLCNSPLFSMLGKNLASLCNMDITHASTADTSIPLKLFHVCFTSMPNPIQSLKSHRHCSVPYWGFLSVRAAQAMGCWCCRGQGGAAQPRPPHPEGSHPQLLQALGSPSEPDTPGWLCAQLCCSSGHAASSPEVAPGNSLALFAVSWISIDVLL